MHRLSEPQHCVIHGKLQIIGIVTSYVLENDREKNINHILNRIFRYMKHVDLLFTLSVKLLTCGRRRKCDSLLTLRRNNFCRCWIWEGLILCVGVHFISDLISSIWQLLYVMVWIAISSQFSKELWTLLHTVVAVRHEQSSLLNSLKGEHYILKWLINPREIRNKSLSQMRRAFVMTDHQSSHHSTACSYIFSPWSTQEIQRRQINTFLNMFLAHLASCW